jgi:type I restriction enzyme R subunit
MKEATARIKINKLLEEAGWRFFQDGKLPANIRLEHNATITYSTLDAFGNNFEKTKTGFVDFLLTDEKGFPLIILEAKAEDINPLSAKEQARTYAKSQNCRFIILSNGNLHYLWDLERGSPNLITAFPTPESITTYRRTAPNPQRLIEEQVSEDFIALTQFPTYRTNAAWNNPAERPGFIESTGLRFLRDYQLRAIKSLQAAVKDGKDRFLFEMATGTGKTLTAAAIIKLFLRSRNASRVLFLVDRLELEDQAYKNFVAYLRPDYSTVIYKEKREEWRNAEVVVSTVQSFLFNNKYKDVFSPTDFDLVISDEAHRSIGGNARAVFDYFVGYKLGLTATPRDYLKAYDKEKSNGKDPREYERRLMLDTYRTFGCEDSQPTFRYTLTDGVKEGHLINPTVVDARTSVTTQLLSEQGFVINFADENGQDQTTVFKQTAFEKSFVAERTNELFCKTFLERGLRDPISNEFGKSIIFAVSQNHAAKLVQILNKMADKMYPGHYQSDFAVQVTSLIPEAQQFTINFTNNNLLGSANLLPAYKTSKARICVTVGMMTTGYDCPDLLNLGLMRPIFSPTDFIQIKGRGTRKHDFTEELFDTELKENIGPKEKTSYKLFDFFANCQYFEEEFKYDEVIKLPSPGSPGDPIPSLNKSVVSHYDHDGEDVISTIKEETIGPDGMLIDRMFYARFEEAIKQDPTIKADVEAERWDQAVEYVKREVLDKPTEFYTLEKLRKAAAVDRRLSLREILEKTFGLIPRYKSKDELLEEEFAKFMADLKPDESDAIPAIKHYFKAYIANGQVRDIIEGKHFTDLATNPVLPTDAFKAVPSKYRTLIPEYVKDYVSLNQFLN